MKDKDIITAKQMMKATIGGENIEETNKEIMKMNKGNGRVSPQEMREYLLREPSEEFKIAEREYEREKEIEDRGDEDEYNCESEETEVISSIDLYDEYARQFGGLLIKLMEEKPDLAKSNDWLLISQKELVLKDSMEDWLTVLSAKWSESMARYALNKPYIKI